MRLEDRITRLERLVAQLWGASSLDAAERDRLFALAQDIRTELEAIDRGMFGEGRP